MSIRDIGLVWCISEVYAAMEFTFVFC